MLLGMRGVPDPTPPKQPEFDVVTNGLDPEQVQQYLEILLSWAQRQLHRAEGAEQTLAGAVNQLRDADTTATGTSAGPGAARSPATTVHAASALRSVPRPRHDGDGHDASPPRRKERTAPPTLSKPSPPPPARPSVTVSRLDDRLVSSALTSLLGGSRWDQLRGRRSPWSAFHLRSLEAGSRHVRYTIVAGPSGLFSLSTPYHRGAEIVVDRSRVLIDGQESADAARIADEADRVGALVREALRLPDNANEPGGLPRSSALNQAAVRPVLAFTGVRCVRIERSGRMIVTTTANLAAYLRALPVSLGSTELDTIAALSQHS
jgi:hypothetical protein